MILIRFSKITSLYEELTPFYNPSNAEEFFMQFKIDIDHGILFIVFVEYGINITNSDSDVWIRDNDKVIFYHKLTPIIRSSLIELIEEFIEEDHQLVVESIY